MAVRDEQLVDSTKLLLERLARRLRAQRIELVFTDDVVRLLARESVEPGRGGRAIEHWIEDEASRMVRAGGIRPGDRVVMHASGDELQFDVEGAAREQAAGETPDPPVAGPAGS